MTGQEFREMRRRAGVSVAETARQLEVAERTIKRWQSWPKVPPAAVKLFRLLNRCDVLGNKLPDVATAADGGKDLEK